MSQFRIVGEFLQTGVIYYNANKRIKTNARIEIHMLYSYPQKYFADGPLSTNSTVYVHNRLLRCIPHLSNEKANACIKFQKIK